MNLDQALQRCPLVAILRGVTPDVCLALADVLLDCGFSMIEVPLNSPQPMESIERLSRAHASHALIGAGTVLESADVERVKQAYEAYAASARRSAPKQTASPSKPLPSK